MRGLTTKTKVDTNYHLCISNVEKKESMIQMVMHMVIIEYHLITTSKYMKSRGSGWSLLDMIEDLFSDILFGFSIA